MLCLAMISPACERTYPTLQTTKMCACLAKIATVHMQLISQGFLLLFQEYPASTLVVLWTLHTISTFYPIAINLAFC